MQGIFGIRFARAALWLAPKATRGSEIKQSHEENAAINVMVEHLHESVGFGLLSNTADVAEGILEFRSCWSESRRLLQLTRSAVSS